MLHAIVFLDGSDDEVVDPDAADEALEYMAGYLQRLDGRELRRVQRGHGRAWSPTPGRRNGRKQLVRFLKDVPGRLAASATEDEA